MCKETDAMCTVRSSYSLWRYLVTLINGVVIAAQLSRALTKALGIFLGFLWLNHIALRQLQCSMKQINTKTKYSDKFALEHIRIQVHKDI